MNEKLFETLQSLREEIAKLGPGEMESKHRLERLIADIETKIDIPGDLDHHASLVDNVKDSVTFFEVSHPRVTGILNDVMMALSNMGI